MQTFDVVLKKMHRASVCTSSAALNKSAPSPSKFKLEVLFLYYLIYTSLFSSRYDEIQTKPLLKLKSDDLYVSCLSQNMVEKLS